ncbi:hypothetical protein [Nonomuraea candida]|uniref:hypothetical protein n=1 Tax=Nonomuraea candida TaxID=359159 RepID=UPI0005B76AB5|nr:hypothetical protein [Nonomuraea candida]
MPENLSGLGRVRPLHDFARELKQVWEEGPVGPVSFEHLADRLETSRLHVEAFLNGSAAPSPVDLALLLVALDPSIGGPEIAAWQTCLHFASVLEVTGTYEGDPVREFLRILRPLEEGGRTLASFPDRRAVHLPRDASGLPPSSLLQTHVKMVFPERWRRAPWLLAYNFARQIMFEENILGDYDDEPDLFQGERRDGDVVHYPQSHPVPPGALPQRWDPLAVQVAKRRARAVEDPQAQILTIFISDENQHQAVESAVAEWLAARGVEVTYESDPVIGSFWKTMLTRVKKGAEEHLDDGAALAARAAGLYGLDTRQAEVNQKEAEAFAKVMEAIANMDSAIIHHGTLLVVKHAGTVVRRELSQLEVEALRRNPILTTRPDIILTELQRHAEELAMTAEAPPTEHSAS